MSFCEVDFSGASEDADPVEFFDVRTVTARKPHACYECDGLIAVGERYTYRAFKFNGEFSAEHICSPCQETAAEFEYHIFGGSLWENLRSEWDAGARVQSCIQRLTTARAKEHMRQQWAKWLDGEHARALKQLRTKA